MYCPKCGKQNNEDSSFCSACGNPLAPSVAAAPALKGEPEPNISSFSDFFCLSVRKFLSSPFTIIVLIFYSIAHLVRIVQVNEALESARDLTDLLSNLALFYESNVADYVINFVALIMIVPGILFAIGLWLLFWDNREHSFDLISTRGLRIIGVVYRAQQILFCVCILITEIVVSLIFPNFDTTGFWLGAGVIVFGVLGFFMYQWPIWMLRSMSTAASYCVPNLEYVTASAVLYFINSGIQFLGAASAELTLSSLLICGIPLLIGILLLKYKFLMEKLYVAKSEAYKKDRVTSSQPVASQSPLPTPVSSSTGYSQDRIPTWQRIQMEQEAAQKEK